MKLLVVAVFSLFTSIALRAETIHCYGPEVADAKLFYVFLHGAGPWLQKSHTHRALERIAKKNKVRFAVPISDMKCAGGDYKGKPCWLTDAKDDTAYRPALKVIEQAAEKCFPRKDHGLMGFSNGGALTMMLARECVRTPFTQLIAVGAPVKTSQSDRQGLKGCTPPLKMLVGSRDSLLEDSRKAYETLKERGYDVTFEEYKGGHEVIADPLYKLFE